MSALSFSVPLPPSANALTFNKKSGGRAATKAYTAWTEEARWIVNRAWHEAGKPVFAKVPLQLILSVGADRRRDVSNCVKAVEDMIVKAIPDMPDDRWNDRLTVFRSDDADGLVHVDISTLCPHLKPG